MQFVNAGVRGLFCYAFCDFGDDFEVVDQDGEEPREVFISNITKVKYLVWQFSHQWCSSLL